MSYTILYRAMFVKMNDNKYIPLVEAGSNNCYESTWNGRQRRCRDWHQWKWEDDKLAYTREELIEAVEQIIEKYKQRYVGTPRPEYEHNPGIYTEKEIERRFGYFSGIAINGNGHCNNTTAQQFRNFFLKGFEQSVETSHRNFRLDVHCINKWPNYEHRTAKTEEELIEAWNELHQYNNEVWIGYDYNAESLWEEHHTRPIKKAPQEHTTGYVVNYRCCYGSCFVLKMSGRRLWHATGLERAKVYTTRAAAEKAAQRINQCYETIQDTAIVYAVEKGEYGWQLAA